MLGSGSPVDVGQVQDFKRRRGPRSTPWLPEGSPGPWAGTCSVISFLGRRSGHLGTLPVTALGARGRVKPLSLTSQVPLNQPPELED